MSQGAVNVTPSSLRTARQSTGVGQFAMNAASPLLPGAGDPTL
jgi:hypothetical protein